MANRPLNCESRSVKAKNEKPCHAHAFLIVFLPT